MPPKIDAVSQKNIADMVGLTPERIRQLVHEGLPQVMRSGKPLYVPREVVRWLRERDREAGRREASSESGEIDEARERARKMRADANLRELDEAERRRELVPADEAREFTSNLVVGFAAVATGRLQQFEREIVAVGRSANPAADARRLTQRMAVALLEGAQGYADTLEREASDELPEAA